MAHELNHAGGDQAISFGEATLYVYPSLLPRRDLGPNLVRNQAHVPGRSATAFQAAVEAGLSLEIR